MTIVEVMVAAIIMVLGALGVLGLVDGSTRGTYRAEQSQVVSDRLQQEVEKIKQLPYRQVALTGLPTQTSDPELPSSRVSGVNFATGSDGGGILPLAYNGSMHGGSQVTGGVVNPAPTTFSSGDVSGTIYRYIVWDTDPTCQPTCSEGSSLKRVVVAIRLDSTASGGTRSYQELQAQVVDPGAMPEDNTNPLPSGDDTSVPWTFFLTDTTCDQAGRQPITADHLTHNTRGACTSGMQTGNVPGAPDLLWPEAPPYTAETPFYDYATDIEPTVNPGTDKGLQVRRENTNGCLSSALTIASAPESDTTRFQRVHKWLSPPMPTGTDIQLDGGGTLNLWTRTVNGAVYEGRLCVWLFVRSAAGTVDTPAINQSAGLAGQPYFQYTEQQWPMDWTEIHVPLDFSLGASLTAGTRLGIVVTSERSWTGGDGIEIFYDEPSFDSRLEVETTDTLPDFLG